MYVCAVPCVRVCACTVHPSAMARAPSSSAVAAGLDVRLLQQLRTFADDCRAQVGLLPPSSRGGGGSGLRSDWSIEGDLAEEGLAALSVRRSRRAQQRHREDKSDDASSGSSSSDDDGAAAAGAGAATDDDDDGVEDEDVEDEDGVTKGAGVAAVRRVIAPVQSHAAWNTAHADFCVRLASTRIGAHGHRQDPDAFDPASPWSDLPSMSAASLMVDLNAWPGLWAAACVVNATLNRMPLQPQQPLQQGRLARARSALERAFTMMRCAVHVVVTRDRRGVSVPLGGCAWAVVVLADPGRRATATATTVSTTATAAKGATVAAASAGVVEFFSVAGSGSGGTGTAAAPVVLDCTGDGRADGGDLSAASIAVVCPRVPRAVESKGALPPLSAGALADDVFSWSERLDLVSDHRDGAVFVVILPRVCVHEFARVERTRAAE